MHTSGDSSGGKRRWNSSKLPFRPHATFKTSRQHCSTHISHINLPIAKHDHILVESFYPITMCQCFCKGSSKDQSWCWCKLQLGWHISIIWGNLDCAHAVWREWTSQYQGNRCNVPQCIEGKRLPDMQQWGLLMTTFNQHTSVPLLLGIKFAWSEWSFWYRNIVKPCTAWNVLLVAQLGARPSSHSL